MELYTDGESATNVQSVKEDHNGIEAYRRLAARYDPASESQAMGIYQQAFSIGQAKTTEQIWQKIEELEDLERQCQDHRVDGTGFEDMFKRFTIHNI